MRRDLRPFWVKQVYLTFRSLWVWWFLAPRCELLGEHATIMSPWFVIISGPNIRIGHSFTAIGEIHHPVQIGVWGRNFGEGRVELGSACLMSPGARISASDEVVLGNGCMMAHGSYMTGMGSTTGLIEMRSLSPFVLVTTCGLAIDPRS